MEIIKSFGINFTKSSPSFVRCYHEGFSLVSSTIFFFDPQSNPPAKCSPRGFVGAYNPSCNSIAIPMWCGGGGGLAAAGVPGPGPGAFFAGAFLPSPVLDPLGDEGKAGLIRANFPKLIKYVSRPGPPSNCLWG